MTTPPNFPPEINCLIATHLAWRDRVRLSLANVQMRRLLHTPRWWETLVLRLKDIPPSVEMYDALKSAGEFAGCIRVLCLRLPVYMPYAHFGRTQLMHLVKRLHSRLPRNSQLEELRLEVEVAARDDMPCATAVHDLRLLAPLCQFKRFKRLVFFNGVFTLCDTGVHDLTQFGFDTSVASISVRVGARCHNVVSSMSAFLPETLVMRVMHNADFGAMLSGIEDCHETLKRLEFHGVTPAHLSSTSDVMDGDGAEHLLATLKSSRLEVVTFDGCHLSDELLCRLCANAPETLTSLCVRNNALGKRKRGTITTPRTAGKSSVVNAVWSRVHVLQMSDPASWP